MKQMGLFKNSKQMNKELIKKMTSPKRKRSSVVAGQPTGNSRNSISTRVAIAEDNAVKLLYEMKQQQPEYNFELVTDQKRLRQYINKIVENGIVALDTEGSGLDPIDDYVCGISLYTPGENAIYIPFWHTDLQENVLEGQMKFDEVHQEIKVIAEASYTKDLKVIYANAKYDMRIMYHTLGYYIKPYWDVILASNFLNENEPSGLKYLWDKYVYRNEVPKNLKTFNKLFDRLGFNWFNPEKVYVYAGNDALMTYQVYEFQKEFLHEDGKHTKEQQLEDAGKLFLEIEMPLIQHLVNMEDLGITIDIELADNLTETYNKRLEKVTNEVTEMIRKFDLSSLSIEVKSKLTNPINVGSPAQIAIILYDVLQLDQIAKRGTGEDVLKQLMEKYETHEKFLSMVLDYRGLTKILSTYITKMPQLVKEKTGKLHGQFNQYGAKTGRFSSKEPNLQNIPARNRDVRPMFTATEGYYLISGDFKQQEPRVLAHLSQDPEMIKAYADGKDLYSWIASVVYNKPYEDCLEFNIHTGEYCEAGDQMRDEMKSIVLGK